MKGLFTLLITGDVIRLYDQMSIVESGRFWAKADVAYHKKLKAFATDERR